MSRKPPVGIRAAWIAIFGVIIIAIATLAVPIVEDWLAGRSSSREVHYVGRVLDANSEQPIAGAKITLDVQGVPPIVYTDSEGVYRFRLPIESDISGTVRVDAPGYAPYTRNITLSSREEDLEDIRLTPQNPAPTQALSLVQPGSWSIDYFSNIQLNPPVVYHIDQPAEQNSEGGYTIKIQSAELHSTPQIPQSNFSVRLSGIFHFEDGYYEFHCEHHDGCRVYVDGKIWVDAWWDGGGGHELANNIFAGDHIVSIEFYDKSGLGLLEVIWKLKAPIESTDTAPTAPPTPSPEPVSDVAEYFVGLIDNYYVCLNSATSDSDYEVCWNMLSDRPGEYQLNLNKNNYLVQWKMYRVTYALFYCSKNVQNHVQHFVHARYLLYDRNDDSRPINNGAYYYLEYLFAHDKEGWRIKGANETINDIGSFCEREPRINTLESK